MLEDLTELEVIIYGTIVEGSKSFQKLHVCKLPKLGYFWKSRSECFAEQPRIITFIYTEACANLCYLFSVTTQKSLVQLQQLCIYDVRRLNKCYGMK